MAPVNFSIPSFSAPNSRDLFLASKKGLQTFKDLDRYKSFLLRHLIQSEADLAKPIGFIANSSDELIMAIASCWMLGIPFCCLNPQAPEHELQNKIDRLDLGTLIIEEQFNSKVRTERAISFKNLNLQKALNQGKLSPVSSKEFKPKTDPDQVFGYFFTSGTSATPKIVPLKRRQMLFAASTSADNFRPEPNHFWLLCLPLNHIAGISIVLRSLLYGSGIYRMNNFDQEMVTTFLSENKLFQAASLVPTMLKRLIEIPAFQTHKDFKAILLGGGPTTSSLLKKAVQKGIPVVSSYGMTETCAQIAANPFLKPSGRYIPMKSVGNIFQPNNIEIRDDSGKPVGTNTSGTIWLKGPQVFDGYWEANLNDQIFDEEGWFNTGDYGHLNINRHLFIESRRSDLIITGGENVSPFEIEKELERIEYIQSAAVLGVPDKEWGERVVAAVVSREKNRIDQKEVRDKLAERLTSFKIPKQIIQVDELPTTRTGKIVRDELRSLFEN